jgi:hypothetical protein
MSAPEFVARLTDSEKPCIALEVRKTSTISRSSKDLSIVPPCVSTILDFEFNAVWCISFLSLWQTVYSSKPSGFLLSAVVSSHETELRIMLVTMQGLFGRKADGHNEWSCICKSKGKGLVGSNIDIITIASGELSPSLNRRTKLQIADRSRVEPTQKAPPIRFFLIACMASFGREYWPVKGDLSAPLALYHDASARKSEAAGSGIATPAPTGDDTQPCGLGSQIPSSGIWGPTSAYINRPETQQKDKQPIPSYTTNPPFLVSNTMQFSTVFATLTLFVAAAVAGPAPAGQPATSPEPSPAPAWCPVGDTQICCYNIDTNFNVGYYCTTPDQAFPCQGENLLPLCCGSYDLTPRGVSTVRR